MTDTKKAKGVEAAAKQEFLKVFEKLRDEIIYDKCLGDQPQLAIDYAKKMMDYNTPHGKLNRGMAVLDVVKAIQEDASDELVFKANVLGWCIEFLQAYFLVADDIMDGSITRRGQPCWYKLPEIGMNAVNDGIYLENAIYLTLRNHFRSEPYYARLMELFHEVTFQTVHGQMLDLITAPIGTVDLSRYTIDTYMRIVTYKTAFYSFYLPVACGMVVTGVEDDAALSTAREILLEMGQYFQIQDDYLDAFGDPEFIGKVGTDIEDNKCSWLVVKALSKATAEHRKLLEEHYGKPEPEGVAKVKQIYRELGLEKDFQDYEAESYKKLCAKIEQQTVLPKSVFTSLLNKIYKRTK
uniref:Farnesyl diphosphate synthase n=1 Tax=Tetraselmis sp. GSL018 TaxID=582737 RepID=A0A061RPF1_9CHLO